MTEPEIQACGWCPSPAQWVICDLVGSDLVPTYRWFTCGRHVHTGLKETRGHWETDAVQIMDMGNPDDEL